MLTMIQKLANFHSAKTLVKLQIVKKKTNIGKTVAYKWPKIVNLKY